MLYRISGRVIAAGVVVVSLALGALVSATAPGLAATPTATATPFASATATRDNLLTIAKTATFKADDAIHGFGVYAVWSAAFPGVSIDGYGVLATGSSISTYEGSLYPKESLNPIAIAFALKDATGACAAGGISGSDGFTTYQALTLAAGAACSGQSALDALRLKLPLAATTATATATAVKTATVPPTPSGTAPAASATAPATAVAVAPLPPTTGTGPRSESAPALPLSLAGAVLLLGGAAVFGLRRRQ